jgi:hypothetical protein
MIVLPGFTAVTNPPLFTVATDVFDEVQGLLAAGVPEPVSVVVELSQIVVGPVIVGWALTVTVTELEQPLLLV